MEELQELRKRVEKLEEQNHSIDKIVTVISEKLDNIIKSLDKLTTQNEKNLLEAETKYKELEVKVEKLKEELNEKTTGKDAKKWDNVSWLVLSNVIVLILGFVFTVLKLK